MRILVSFVHIGEPKNDLNKFIIILCSLLEAHMLSSSVIEQQLEITN